MYLVLPLNQEQCTQEETIQSQKRAAPVIDGSDKLRKQ
jgi:hypothetical protein